MKAKNFIIVGAGILIFVIFLIWLVVGSKSETANIQWETSFLAPEEIAHDFGKISMSDGKVSYEFIVKNQAQTPTKIKRVYTSCMCTQAEFILGWKTFGPFGMLGHSIIPSINQLIEAGEKFIIKVTFDPAAHGPAGLGEMKRQVYIEEEGVKDPLILNISAFVQP